jgi:hypothetical protein
MRPMDVKEGVVLGPEESQGKPLNEGRTLPRMKAIQFKGPTAWLGLFVLPIAIGLMMSFGILFLLGMFAAGLLGSLGVGIARGLGLPSSRNKSTRLK